MKDYAQVMGTAIADKLWSDLVTGTARPVGFWSKLLWRFIRCRVESLITGRGYFCFYHCDWHCPHGTAKRGECQDKYHVWANTEDAKKPVNYLGHAFMEEKKTDGNT